MSPPFTDTSYPDRPSSNLIPGDDSPGVELCVGFTGVRASIHQRGAGPRPWSQGRSDEVVWAIYPWERP
jgi:hypothetical protein